MSGGILAEVVFEGVVVHWRGPAPYLFVTVPGRHVAVIREAAQAASYGWGCVPVEAGVKGVVFTTSLFPKDGGYLLPLKSAVRTEAAVSLGDLVDVELRVRAPGQVVPNGSTPS